MGSADRVRWGHNHYNQPFSDGFSNGLVAQCTSRHHLNRHHLDRRRRRRRLSQVKHRSRADSVANQVRQRRQVRQRPSHRPAYRQPKWRLFTTLPSSYHTYPSQQRGTSSTRPKWCGCAVLNSVICQSRSSMIAHMVLAAGLRRS